MSETLKGKLSISRWHGGAGEGVTIALEDANSHCQLFEISCDVETFGRAIFGSAYLPVEYELGHVENAGLVRETKPLEFRMPRCDYKHEKENAAKLAEQYADEGWTASTYFNSQRSFTRDGDEVICRTHQVRFVEPQ